MGQRAAGARREADLEAQIGKLEADIKAREEGIAAAKALPPRIGCVAPHSFLKPSVCGRPTCLGSGPICIE